MPGSSSETIVPVRRGRSRLSGCLRPVVKPVAGAITLAGGLRCSARIVLSNSTAAATGGRYDVCMLGWVTTTLTLLLALEALNALLWASRIVSAAAAYDAVVLVMVALRVAVAALQLVSARLLSTRALPGVTLSRLAVILSAGLLVLELGVRLSPSSVLPGLRLPIVVGYALYAAAAVVALNRIGRSNE